MRYFLFLIISYFIGSISFAVIISKWHGIDILKEGSGNPGSTNVKRVVGKKAGNLVFALDFLKGALPVGSVLHFFPDHPHVFYLGILALIGTILGHSFSIFLKFKGGKGVAVSMGGIMMLMPVTCFIGLLIWVITFYLTRYVSLASLLFGFSLPLSSWLLSQKLEFIVLSSFLTIFIIIRHLANIKRLLSGTENKFEKK